MCSQPPTRSTQLICIMIIIQLVGVSFNLEFVKRSTVDKIKVRLGEWDAGGSSEPHHHQDFSIAEITINPEYNRKNLRSDLAILTLSKPVALRRSPHIAAACVPPLDTSFVGQRFISGFS
jgi:Trypsin